VANKTVKKKKAYQAHCREQVKQGLFNDHEGNWKPESQLNRIHQMMFDHCRAGYKLNG
jgi:hypothetical protein